jgi:hypothetical protein
MNDQHLTKGLKAVFVVFAAIAAFLLLAEHRAHIVPYLPWLLLAACPLMHVFMHHGKHRHGNNQTGVHERNGDQGAGHA